MNAIDAIAERTVRCAVAPETSGEAAVAAIRRYEKGEPRKLEAQSTSNPGFTVTPDGEK